MLGLFQMSLRIVGEDRDSLRFVITKADGNVLVLPPEAKLTAAEITAIAFTTEEK